MLLGDNHPNNENMIDSKKYHIFYDKKCHLSYAIFKNFLYHLIVWCILCKISKNPRCKGLHFFNILGQKPGFLQFWWNYSHICNKV